MATTNEETKEKPAGAEGTAGAESKAAAAPPAKEAAPKETAKEKPAAEGGAGGEKTELRRMQLKDTDDDIPDNADLLELSPRALKARLGRHTKKELRDRFGTDNFDDIKERLDRLNTLEAQEEERKRQQMSETERLQADLKKERERAERAERKANAVFEQRVVEAEESRIFKLAEKAGMDPEYIEDQYPKLARFLNENYSPKELKKLKDGDIEKWFKERIKAKPKLAKDQEERKEEAPKPKVGLNNGANASGRPNPDGNASKNTTEKTFKPGQANSMTPAEARREAAKMGYRY